MIPPLARPSRSKDISKIKDYGNYCHGCEFCGCGGGLVFGGGGLVVGGGSVCGDCGGVSTADGFQRSYVDLTPSICPVIHY